MKNVTDAWKTTRPWWNSSQVSTGWTLPRPIPIKEESTMPDAITNKINHFVVLLDKSSSMQPHKYNVVKFTDRLIQTWAEQSKFHDQETRATVYTFCNPQYNDGKTATNLIFDKDVLRVPSIAGHYEPRGGTALCSAVLKVIEDMKDTSQLYGDHSFTLFLVSDGEELHSPHADRLAMPKVIASLPDNWTVGALAPSMSAKQFLIQFGLKPGNVEIWDPNRADAIEEVGVVLAASTDQYMRSRSSGMRSTTSLFSMAAPDVQAVKAALTPMTEGSYFFIDVEADKLVQVQNGRIDQYYELATGKAYAPGLAYYQMFKRERIQSHKKLALAERKTGKVYVGGAARTMLGLPEQDSGAEVRISPGKWSEYDVFIQSTSMNRKLYPGTRLLVMR